MSEQKHTPGPLSFDMQDEEGFFRFFSIRTESGRSIGTVDDEHDARLFAAAPELIAALEVAVEYFDRNEIDCIAHDDAKAAIKKAKGE